MESDVEGAILDVLAGMPDARCQRVGSLWRVSVGGLSGARKDGIGLARDLRAQYEYRKAREAGMVPDPPPERPAYRDNPAQARKIAELEAALAAKEAARNEPPEALKEFIREGEPFGEAQERLWKEYNYLTGLLMSGLATAEQTRMHTRLHGALYWVSRGAVEIL